MSEHAILAPRSIAGMGAGSAKTYTWDLHHARARQREGHSLRKSIFNDQIHRQERAFETLRSKTKLKANGHTVLKVDS